MDYLFISLSNYPHSEIENNWPLTKFGNSWASIVCVIEINPQPHQARAEMPIYEMMMAYVLMLLLRLMVQMRNWLLRASSLDYYLIFNLSKVANYPASAVYLVLVLMVILLAELAATFSMAKEIKALYIFMCLLQMLKCIEWMFWKQVSFVVSDVRVVSRCRHLLFQHWKLKGPKAETHW